MERGMTVDQVLKALWRRKLLVLAIAGGVFAVGAAIVATMPSQYQATAVIRVEPHHPIADMVQPTVSEAVERRIVTVRQELLSRPVLQKVIEQQNLYPETVAEYGIDGAVAQMREDLEVRLEGDAAFEVSYTATDPQVAADVVNLLPAVFAEQAVLNRQAQARRTSDLFGEEVKVLQDQVTGLEKKIAEFKVAHVGELPEQLEVNMRGMERISAQIQSRYDELRMAEIRRADLLRAHHSGDSEAGRLKAQELEAQRALLAARANWTADHPEVQRLSRELGGIRQKLRAAEGRLVEERNERIRMGKVIAQIQGTIEELNKQGEAYQKRLDNTPKWTHELALLTRDYEATRAKYESVLSRKVEADLARDLEVKSAKDIFNVISPATVPVVPAKPDRMGGLIIAALIALALGILTAVVAEMRDDSIRDMAEARDRLPVPVLAVVPEMEGKTEKRVLLPNHMRPGQSDTIN